LRRESSHRPHYRNQQAVREVITARVTLATHLCGEVW
jgi:hypothetical protein